jgi:hypothetical protein
MRCVIILFKRDLNKKVLGGKVILVEGIKDRDEHCVSATALACQLPSPASTLTTLFQETNSIKMKYTIIAALVASATAFTVPKVEVPAVSCFESEDDGVDFEECLRC